MALERSRRLDGLISLYPSVCIRVCPCEGDNMDGVSLGCLEERRLAHSFCFDMGEGMMVAII